jgi:hypothetical protein
MKKIRKSIAEIKEEIYDTLGGIAGAVKYYKRHPSAFYPDYFRTPPQPVVQNNVNIANLAVDDQSARRKLEDAFIRLIDAQKHYDIDPAVFVNDQRIDPFGRVIEHHPASTNPADARPATDATRPASPNSPPSTAEPRPASPYGRRTTAVQSFVAGQCAGALELDDNLSTTQRYLNWPGHGRPP